MKNEKEYIFLRFGFGFGQQGFSKDFAYTIKGQFEHNNFIIEYGSSKDGNLEPKILLEMEGIKSCASRKRGDEHKIETRKDDVANCVTSIDTDSMVQEPIIYDGLNNRIPKDQDIMGTVVPQFSRFGITNGYKIIEKMEEPLKIPQATKQGYIECPVGGVFDASYPNSELRRGRVQENGEVSPALTTNSEGAILRYEGVEPQILTPLRTEEGKELRKQGIEKFSNRALYPREDGVSNTITSVQKDNLLQEPSTQCVNYFDENGKQRSLQDRIYDSSGQSTAITTSFHPNIVEPDKGGMEYRGRFVKEGDGIAAFNSDNFSRNPLEGVSPTIRAEKADASTCVKAEAKYRIRKLTEREVFRLMDVSEEDIDKIQATGISKTAQYRLAGNSIVVSCLYHIFRKMFVEPGCEEQQLSLF